MLCGNLNLVKLNGNSAEGDSCQGVRGRACASPDPKITWDLNRETGARSGADAMWRIERICGPWRKPMSDAWRGDWRSHGKCHRSFSLLSTTSRDRIKSSSVQRRPSTSRCSRASMRAASSDNVMSSASASSFNRFVAMVAGLGTLRSDGLPPDARSLRGLRAAFLVGGIPPSRECLSSTRRGPARRLGLRESLDTGFLNPVHACRSREPYA